MPQKHHRRVSHAPQTHRKRTTDMPDLSGISTLLETFHQAERRRYLLLMGIPAIGPRHYGPAPIGRVTWSPQAYAALRGLTGTAAHLFTEMAGALLQQTRENTPW